MYARGLSSRNATAYELALVVIVAAVLVTLFLRRMDRVEAMMEQAGMRLVVQDLQSRLVMLRAVADGGAGGEAGYADANPVGTLIPDLPGYAGEQERVDWAAVGAGQWVYERATATLWYRPVHADRVQGGGEPPRFGWRIADRYVDVDGDGRYAAGSDRFLGLVLEPASAARWSFE